MRIVARIYCDQGEQSGALSNQVFGAAGKGTVQFTVADNDVWYDAANINYSVSRNCGGVTPTPAGNWGRGP